MYSYQQDPARNPPSSSVRFQMFLSRAIPFMWIVFLGFAIWHDVKKTTMPPSYDALVYFEKGKNVWEHLNPKNFVNPLNVESTYRPPATVLMSFPFGYRDDFRGFYFRSIFIPVLCFMAAVYIAGYSTRTSTLRSWILCFAAIFLSSIPFFYHFEYTDSSLNDSAVPVYYWGLVDAFLGGVSALAAAACVRGIQKLSLKWFTLSFVLASLCILIKPAGLLTMALIAGSWCLFMVLELWAQDRESKKQVLKQSLLIGGVMVAIYGSTLIMCFNSKYLSPGNLAYGKTAMETLKADFALPITLKTIWVFIFPSLGWILPIGTIILLILGWAARKDLHSDQNPRVLASLLLSAFVALACGIWFWLFRTGITQVRFFVPLAMMAIVYAVPLSLQILGHYRKLANIIIFSWCVQVINLGLLLLHPSPSEVWQQWSGVYLSTSSCRAEIAQAQELLSQSREKKTNSRVYALDTSAAYGAFLSVASYASIIHPQQPSFEVEFPIDWESASVIRIHDIVTSDYLLFRPLYDPAARKRLLAMPSVQDLFEEKLLFEAALTDLTEQNGIQKISETSVRLLKITDPPKLLKSLEAMQGEHTWPAAFMRANPKECWTLQEIKNTWQSQSPAVSNLIFENTFEIDALQVDRSNGNINLRLWWKPLSEEAGKDWNLFIHELAKDGSILSNRAIALQGENQCSNDSPSHGVVVSFPASSNPPMYGIGIGFYRPTPKGLVLLHAQSGVRDWGNQRVVIAVPLSPKDQ